MEEAKKKADEELEKLKAKTELYNETNNACKKIKDEFGLAQSMCLTKSMKLLYLNDAEKTEEKKKLDIELLDLSAMKDKLCFTLSKANDIGAELASDIQVFYNKIISNQNNIIQQLKDKYEPSEKKSSAN